MAEVTPNLVEKWCSILTLVIVLEYIDGHGGVVMLMCRSLDFQVI